MLGTPDLCAPHSSQDPSTPALDLGGQSVLAPLQYQADDQQHDAENDLRRAQIAVPTGVAMAASGQRDLASSTRFSATYNRNVPLMLYPLTQCQGANVSVLKITRG